MSSLVQSPIIALVGNKGTGKTLFMTFIAEKSHFVDNKKVYSNFKLNNIPYILFNEEMLLNLPEDMNNGVILIDEAHMVSDSYAFLSDKSKALTTLATQLRKRNLELYFSTQRFQFISKRIRDLVDYIFAMNPYQKNNSFIRGVANIEVYDRNDSYLEFPIKRFIFDGRKFFNHYDTHEVIK